MDYPFATTNWICRLFGHSYGRSYIPGDFEPYGDGFRAKDGTGPGSARTCSLCGHTRKL